MADEISKEDLVSEIKKIVASSDIKTLSNKKIRDQLEKIFSVNFASRKKEIEQIAMSEIENNASSHSEESEEEIEAPKAKKPAKGRGRKPKKAAGSEDEEDWKTKKAKPQANGKPRKASAFTKSFKLTKELSALVGSDTMPRHEVVKKMWAYIKEKKLQDPKNRQFAICDDQLMKVIGVKRFRTFGMMKYLKDHFVTEA